MSNTLFDDIFQVLEVDPGRYRRIARIEATSTTQDNCKLTLDINTELFGYSHRNNLQLLSHPLSIEGEDYAEVSGTTRSWRPPQPGERSIADDYDYVMYGTAYKLTKR